MIFRPLLRRKITRHLFLIFETVVLMFLIGSWVVKKSLKKMKNRSFAIYFLSYAKRLIKSVITRIFYQFTILFLKIKTFAYSIMCF